jgi:hypothetical protein
MKYILQNKPKLREAEKDAMRMTLWKIFSFPHLEEKLILTCQAGTKKPYKYSSTHNCSWRVA